MQRTFSSLSILSYVLLFSGCGPGGSGASNPEAPTWSLVPEISSPTGESWYSVNGEGNRVLFGRHSENWSSHTIWEMVRDATGEWSEAAVAPFSGEYNDRAARFYTVLDAVLFSSDRPLPGEDGPDYVGSDKRAGAVFNLWVVAHDGDKWMPAEPFEILNSEADDFHASASNMGAIFFASTRDGGRGGADIYRAELAATGYVVAPLAGDVNSEYSESDLFVDPDERFMIVVRTDDPRGRGGDDLFVSFKEGDTWTEPEWLGPSVNTPEDEYGPWISPEGTLYLTSHSGGQADIFSLPASDVPLLARFFP